MRIRWTGNFCEKTLPTSFLPIKPVHGQITARSCLCWFWSNNILEREMRKIGMNSSMFNGQSANLTVLADMDQNILVKIPCFGLTLFPELDIQGIGGLEIFHLHGQTSLRMPVFPQDSVYNFGKRASLRRLRLLFEKQGNILVHNHRSRFLPLFTSGASGPPCRPFNGPRRLTFSRDRSYSFRISDPLDFVSFRAEMMQITSFLKISLTSNIRP